MPDPAESTLISELARDTVQQVAPQELPRFRATSQAYFADPERVLKGEKGKDQMLGFGTGAEMSFLTPIILAVTTQVFRFVADEVARSCREESPVVIHDLVKRLFTRFRSAEADETPSTPPAPPPLTREQLMRIRQLAYDEARRLRLAEAKAGLLADSLVGGLVVSPA